jgi:hypothetical protein
MQKSIGEEDSSQQVAGSWHLKRRQPSPSGAPVITLYFIVSPGDYDFFL